MPIPFIPCNLFHSKQKCSHFFIYFLLIRRMKNANYWRAANFFPNKFLLARQLLRKNQSDQAKSQKPIPDPRSPSPEPELLAYSFANNCSGYRRASSKSSANIFACSGRRLSKSPESTRTFSRQQRSVHKKTPADAGGSLPSEKTR